MLKYCFNKMLSDTENLFLGISEKIRFEKSENGGFLYLDEQKEPFSEAEFSIGNLCNVSKFVAHYRRVSAWENVKVGISVEEIPFDTQFLLCKKENGEYVVFVSMIDDTARTSLFWDDNELKALVLTGAEKIKVHSATLCYIAVGKDVYELIRKAAIDIDRRIGRGTLLKDKKIPDFAKYFGWCTYNAFYSDVTHDKLINAVNEDKQSGFTPGFVLIDDGWQPHHGDYLYSYQADDNKFPYGLKRTVDELKSLGVKKVMAWHTFCGFWGGIEPSEDIKEEVCPTNYETPHAILSRTFNGDSKVERFNTVHPSYYPPMKVPTQLPMHDFYSFYEDYYRTMKENGIDGSKVDAMAWSEGVSSPYGGRVRAARLLNDGMSAASNKYFDGNTICCSGCSNDLLLQNNKMPVTRSSCDYVPEKIETHGKHIYTNAHTALWMSEFILPDWDMFQTHKTAGEFHAMARAISGGPVYCADELGKSRVDIIKRLTFDDGEVVSCSNIARICEDSLFVDYEKDGLPIKVFNKNTYGGVVGIFNCSYENACNGTVSANDIYDFEGNEFAVYYYSKQELRIVKKDDTHKIELFELGSEIVTFMPISNGVAVVGNTDKYNSAGCVLNVSVNDGILNVTVKGSGNYLAYSQNKPKALIVNGHPTEFEYFDGKIRWLQK